MKAFSITIALMCISILMHGQNNVSTIRLLNDSTRQVVMFAHLIWPYGEGTISNSKGIARIGYPKNLSKTDVLKISCIGYHTVNLSYKKLRPEDTITVLMKQKYYNLKVADIEAKGLTPYEIIQSGLKKMNENLPQETKYYHCAYSESREYWYTNKQSESIYLFSEFVLKDPAYKKIYKDLRVSFNDPDNMQEEVYFLSIEKNAGKDFEETFIRPNYLKWTIKESIRYHKQMLNSPKHYHYELKQVLFDSTLNNYIMQIHIYPRNKQYAFEFCDVFITSQKHQILEIHTYTVGDKIPTNTKLLEEEEYRYGNDDYVIKYRINKNGKVVPAYVHQINSNSFYDPVGKNTTATFHVQNHLYFIGEIENGKEEIENLPEMDYELTLFEQPFFKGYSFKMKKDFKIIDP